MQTTNEIIGYRVKSGEQYVHTDLKTTWTSYTQPTPISRSDAYRRAAAFIQDHPDDSDGQWTPTVVPAYRVLTPVETASKELSGLLTALCERHGLQLGLSKEQVEKRLAKELEEFGVTSSQVNNMLGR